MVFRKMPSEDAIKAAIERVKEKGKNDWTYLEKLDIELRGEKDVVMAAVESFMLMGTKICI